MDKSLLDSLAAIVGEENVRPLEPLAPHTTFKIGGPADAFVSPRSVEEVSQVVCACEQSSVPWRVIGCGSDLLVADEGVEGVVIEVRDNLSAIRVDGTRIVAGAGATNAAVAEAACTAGLSGYEFACGIPGTVGGAAIMNAGAYVTGSQLKRLGEYYAQAIHDNFGDDFDVLFGPAYKGIPLAVVTAIAYHELYGKEVKYCCDRKEAKDHGADKGNLLGYEPQDGDRVIMVEDVTTSGKSIDETYPKVKAAADVEIKGLIVSLNRMEVGKGGVTTAQKEIEAKYGFPVASIVSMAEVVETLHNHDIEGKVVIDDALKADIDAYYEQYGVKEQ